MLGVAVSDNNLYPEWKSHESWKTEPRKQTKEHFGLGSMRPLETRSELNHCGFVNTINHSEKYVNGPALGTGQTGGEQFRGDAAAEGAPAPAAAQGCSRRAHPGPFCAALYVIVGPVGRTGRTKAQIKRALKTTVMAPSLISSPNSTEGHQKLPNSSFG